jgi:hypothetical protein
MANFAGRIFNRKQALEREIKDGFAKLSFTQATAVLDLTADITLTSVGSSVARNGSTFTIQVLAAAANPTDTVLVAFTGTSAAITCTVTPNDGTNNGATPVDLTTAELRELISTGAVVGKTVTLTDASSLRALQTATGGGAAALALLLLLLAVQSLLIAVLELVLLLKTVLVTILLHLVMLTRLLKVLKLQF